jgi:hypothetical protein
LCIRDFASFELPTKIKKLVYSNILIAILSKKKCRATYSDNGDDGLARIGPLDYKVLVGKPDYN